MTKSLALTQRATMLLMAVGFLLSLVASGLLAPHSADAAQLTSRKVTIDKAKTSDTDVEHAFAFTIPDTTETKAGIILEFCTTPLGGCTLPTGMDVQAANDFVSQTGWPTNATNFAPVAETANVGDCTLNTNAYMICYSRDETTATGVTGGAVTINISGIDAPSAQGTVYVRVALYNNDDFLTANRIDASNGGTAGVVATAYSDQLTVNGRVQERLNFCLAAVGDGGATDTTLPVDVATCTAITDTTIDIGTIDESAIVYSPVDTTATNGATDDYGIAMVNTNASGGVVVSYYPETAGSGSEELQAFRVTGAACTNGGTDLTDQCFISAANAGETFVVDGTDQERFGLQVACIDTSQGTTSNLGSVPAAYSNTDNDTTHDVDCENDDAGVKFAWNDTTTAATLASSTTVVDDEIVKLRFGALAQATTPTGAYTVTTTYIATPTY